MIFWDLVIVLLAESKTIKWVRWFNWPQQLLISILQNVVIKLVINEESVFTENYFPLAEYRVQLAFKGKQEYIDAEIPYGSRDNAIEPDNVKIMFAIDIDSKDKTCSTVNSVGKILLKKIQQCFHQRKLIQSVKRISMTQEHLLKWKKYEEKLLQSVFKLTKS